MNFIKYNHNPKNRKVGDCSTRALGKALNITWYNAAKLLFEASMKLHAGPTDTETMNEVLKEYSTPIPTVFHLVDGIKKRYRVNEVATWKGIYVVRVAIHWVVAGNGNYYDIWDSGEKCAYKIWRIN